MVGMSDVLRLVDFSSYQGVFGSSSGSGSQGSPASGRGEALSIDDAAVLLTALVLGEDIVYDQWKLTKGGDRDHIGKLNGRIRRQATLLGRQATLISTVQSDLVNGQDELSLGSWFSPESTTRSQSHCTRVLLSTAEERWRQDRELFQIVGFTSGPDDRYTYSYTSILRLGLTAGDTPDAPHNHLGTRGLSTSPSALPTSSKARATKEHARSSGVLAEALRPARESRLGRRPSIYVINPDTILVSFFRESEDDTTFFVCITKSPEITEKISPTRDLRTSPTTWPLYKYHQVSSFVFTHSFLHTLAHSYICSRFLSRAAGLSIGGASSDTLPAPSDECSLVAGIRTYSPVPDARRDRGPRRGDSSSAELFGYINIITFCFKYLVIVDLITTSKSYRVIQMEHLTWLKSQDMSGMLKSKRKANLDNVAKGILYKTLDKNIFSEIKMCTTAMDIWEKFDSGETMAEFDPLFNIIMIKIAALVKGVHQ
ncbi:Histone-lysine N-methyltransferase EZA1 [Dorcoceras hygrometricum]|uniref:Histone-lysine N-methyltransferase EZA1 n=1 Tax=Dorcoceras hygrometricum TaxID=472368 RepID=A0A2Z7BXD3_9LAMI|nr:Histone-lysine N-methyltransferase EZA1 [Dorcoceras hygrometricum]